MCAARADVWCSIGFPPLFRAILLGEFGFDLAQGRLVGHAVVLTARELAHPSHQLLVDVHRARPFFASLTEFMSSGPCVVLVLEADDAIRKWRTLMGATDPAKADANTLRKDFGRSIENNATHGSDAPDTAAYELGYFFPGIELNR